MSAPRHRARLFLQSIFFALLITSAGCGREGAQQEVSPQETAAQAEAVQQDDVEPESASASPTQPEAVRYQHNRTKQRLADGEPVVGARITLPNQDAAKIMAAAGFDWLFIDLEHIALNPESVLKMIEATSGTDVSVLVRVQGKDQWLANLPLDLGAKGIVVPNVLSKDEAIKAVQSVRYPPEGVRGIGPRAASKNWGVGVRDYLKIANHEIMACILIEHIDAVNQIDDILSVPGIDLVLVGPNDLAASMGLLGELGNPEQEAAIQKVLDATIKAGIPAGTIAATPDQAKQRLEQGFQAILIGQDTNFLAAGAKGVIAEIEQ